jgi:hypothetical protein
VLNLSCPPGRPTKAEILRRAAAAGDREEEEKEMKKLKS